MMAILHSNCPLELHSFMENTENAFPPPPRSLFLFLAVGKTLNSGPVPTAMARAQSLCDRGPH